MIKPIMLIVIAILILICGILLLIKSKENKPVGRSLLTFAIIFSLSGISLIVWPGVRGNLLAALFHTMALMILLVNLLFIRIRKKKPINKKRFKKISIIALSLVIVLVALPILLAKPLGKILKPISHKDGISRSLFVNSFYREKLPGHKYVTPERIEYYSGVTDTTRHALVMLPDNYDENKLYPVFYILHGLGGNEYSWIKKKADIIIQNMCYLYDTPEMIVVFPNSELNEIGDTTGLDYQEKCFYYDKTEEDLVNYLMPYINDNYSVLSGKENTAIAGNSMGGRNTMYTAFAHQDLFGYVGVFSSAGVVKTENDFFPPLLDEVKIDERYGGFNLLMLMVGREDNVCGEVSYILDKKLTEAGIDHIFYDVVGMHQNIVWQNALYNFCMRIFR